MAAPASAKVKARVLADEVQRKQRPAIDENDAGVGGVDRNSLAIHEARTLVLGYNGLALLSTNGYFQATT